MQKIRIVIPALMAVFVVVILFAAWSTTPQVGIRLSPLSVAIKTPTAIPTPYGGLLVNSSFEEPYVCTGGATCVARGWNPWYSAAPECWPWEPNCPLQCPKNCLRADGKCSKDAGCVWAQPEFSQMTLQYPYRIHAGSSAQKVFVYGRMSDFGLWQQVPTQPGQLLEYGVWMEGWQCDNFDECNGGKLSHRAVTATLGMRIGVDPTGGTVPTATTVLWAQPYDSLDTYRPYSVTFRAQSITATLFVRASPVWPYAHMNNDIYVDDAYLRVLNYDRTVVLPLITLDSTYSPTPTPTPSPIPQPTATPGVGVTYTLPANRGGLHVSAVGSHNGYGTLLQGCHNANRPVGAIKVLCDGGSAMQAKVTDPRTTTVYRCFTPDGHGDTSDNPPGNWEWDSSQTHQVAVDWMEANYKNWMVDNNPIYINFYEVTNEANPVSELQWKNFTDFNIECMKIADTWGIKLAIGSFSSGTPENYQIEWFRPALNYAAQHGHALAVHDGSVSGDRPSFQQAYQDGTALRYRQWNFAGYVVVTECYAPDYYRRPNWTDFSWYLDQLTQDKNFGCAWFDLGDYDFGGGSVNVVGQLEGYANAMGCEWPEQMYRYHSR